MTFGDVVNQLHNQNSLADTGTAEQTDFAAFGIRLKQVDNLNAGRQNLGFGRLVDKSGRRTMYRKLRFDFTGPRPSTGSPMTLMMRPRSSGPTGT